MQSEVDLHNCSSFLSFHPPCAQVPFQDALMQALRMYELHCSLRSAPAASPPSPGQQAVELAGCIRVGDKRVVDHIFLEAKSSLISQHGFSRLLVHSGIKADLTISLIMEFCKSSFGKPSNI